MAYKIVDIDKIVGELHEVLVKNQVPIKALDGIVEELINEVYIHTVIQSNNPSKLEEVGVRIHDSKFIPSTSDGIGTGVNKGFSNEESLCKWVGKCQCCGKENEIVLPINKDIIPKFCMNCGRGINYIEKGNTIE